MKDQQNDQKSKEGTLKKESRSKMRHPFRGFLRPRTGYRYGDQDREDFSNYGRGGYYGDGFLLQ
jgi:hypothetical protein